MLKIGPMSGTTHCGARLVFLIGEPISKAFLSFECYGSAEELIRNSQMQFPRRLSWMALEANAHARVRNTFWLKSHRYLMTLNCSACANYP
jgi:hypothetical protein